MTTTCRHCDEAVERKDRCDECWTDYAELWHWECCEESQGW